MRIGFHIVFGLLGVYNLVSNGIYFVSTWREIHGQGIGHLYLTLAALLSFWWMTFVVIGCFLGTAWMPSAGERLILRPLSRTLLGVVLSVLLPQLMLVAWFIVIVWIRSLL